MGLWLACVFSLYRIAPPTPWEKLGCEKKRAKNSLHTFPLFRDFRQTTEDDMNYHKKYNSFYQSRQWKALRAMIFARSNGLCSRCLKKGIITEGKEVHHIVPIDKAWHKRHDADNLILLCDECHRTAHERNSPLQKFNQFWEELENAESGESKS